jgi:hypothetical protein
MVRVLALVLGLQISGTGHLAADALSLAVPSIASHEEERCPPDGACNDCPAGCPQCHCPNAIGSIVPRADVLEALVFAVSKSPALRIEAQAPPSPVLPLPFRPPRANQVVS